MRKFKLILYGCFSMLAVCNVLCSTPQTLRKGGPSSTQEYVITEACMHSSGCLLPRPDGRGTYPVKRGKVLIGESSFGVDTGGALIWARTKPWTMYNQCWGASGPCTVYIDQPLGPSLSKDGLSQDLINMFASEHQGVQCAPYANVDGISFLSNDSIALILMEYPQGEGCKSYPPLVGAFMVAVPSMVVQQELDAKQLLARFRPYLSRFIIKEIQDQVGSRKQQPQ